MTTLLFSLSLTLLFAADTTPASRWEKNDLGETAIFPMKNAPYPHASRAEGFKSKDKVFPRDPHYTDSSVALFIPRGYKPQDRVDLLVYFHGHHNNIRKALDTYKLREQIVASGRNIIFVFPEGPKDVPDSGCGKLEEKDGLKNLVAEVLDTLTAEGKIKSKQVGCVLLSGHSGAYNVLSACVARGGLDENVTEVGLLDASYAQLDPFVDWVVRRKDARFFSIFTDHLAARNVYLMTHMKKKSIRYELLDAEDAMEDVVARSRVLFLHASRLTHDQTVSWLEKWLKGSRPAK